MPDGTITIGGEEVDIGGLCINIDLANFAGMPYAMPVMTAFGKLRDAISIKLGDYVENGLQTVANYVTDMGDTQNTLTENVNILTTNVQNLGDTVTNLGDTVENLGDTVENLDTTVINLGDELADLAGDQIWTQRGAPLPAQAEGGVEGPNIFGQVNNYAGAGLVPPLRGTAPETPSGAYVALLQNIYVDPVGNVVINANGGAEWAYAAKPFTCVAPLVYDGAADEVEHGAVGATTLHESTGQYYKGPRLANDGTGHVAVPETGDFGDLPAPGAGNMRLATATADYDDDAGPGYCTVTADVDGGPSGVTVRLWYRVGLEYPNVRDTNRIQVFQDSGGNWCCLGPHDRPVGAIEEADDSPGSPPAAPPPRLGWKLYEAFNGQFARAYKAGTNLPRQTGGAESHVHDLTGYGSHTHGFGEDYPGHCHGMEPNISAVYVNQGDQVAVVVYPVGIPWTDFTVAYGETSAAGAGGATDSADHIPPFTVVTKYIRVNKVGE